MQLKEAFSICGDMRAALQTAFVPTVQAILRTPSLLFHPRQLSREFMSHVWSVFGPGIDGNTRELKKTYLTPNAYGAVLDVGAGMYYTVFPCTALKIYLLSSKGHGHSVQYLDCSKVTKYIALEPNTAMHAEIRKFANAAGFTEEAGTLVLIAYGAEDISLIISALGGPHTVDTIISILALCGVPEPQATMKALSEQVLKPGGQFLFYEHVRSRRADIAWWQRFWTPIWRCAFDGCCLDRPTDIWLENLGIWQSKDLWDLEGEPEGSLFGHKGGKLVKAA
jgi:SAM-dependent methyltransferase